MSSRKRKYSKEKFIEAVNASKNIYQALLYLNLYTRGRAYQTFKNAAHDFNVDITH